VGIFAVLAIGGAAAARSTRAVDVTAVKIVRGRAVDAIYATGTVEAEHRVTVKAKIAGPVSELRAHEGETVKAGDLLAHVDNPAASYDLDRGRVEAASASAQTAPRVSSARARVETLDVQIAAAKRELGRVHALVATNALASTEEDRARDHVTELESQRAAAQADLDAARIELASNASRARAIVGGLETRVSDADVRAPQEGVVLARYVEPGEVVAVNQSLFKIGDVRSLLLEVRIDEADVARVREGSKVVASLHAFPDQTFGGSVFVVMPDADRDTKSYLAKVRLDTPPAGLRSGMTAEVNIVVTERDGVLLAPADAIKDGQVWRVKDGRASKARVKVGIHDLLHSEIQSGLDEGDLVAVTGVDLLKGDGARVKATTKEP
jgi:RND family efflux transporter MFP subunit